MQVPTYQLWQLSVVLQGVHVMFLGGCCVLQGSFYVLYSWANVHSCDHSDAPQALATQQ